MNLKSRLLSQNFLRNPKLVADLIGKSSIGPNDLVIDIGAGRGIVSRELAKVAGRVIAVEIDSELIPLLQQHLSTFKNVQIYNTDFLHFDLPHSDYKVFANPPFHITADIIYKLLHFSHPPQDAYLIVQKEVAEKFTGSPCETQASLLLKPWFDFRTVWTFSKSDFSPQPDVETVLMHISCRPLPLVLPEEELVYKSFIKFAFGTWKKDLKIGLKSVFTYPQWKRLARDNDFSIPSKPTDLKFNQWLMLFRFFSSLKNQTDPLLKT